MTLYEGAKTRVRVCSELIDKFVAYVGMHQVYVLRVFLILEADVIVLARKGV